jgi:hypothetical protein
MAAFIYRCPATGYNVQAFVADDPTKGAEAYRSITCTVCGRVHLVNPKTGRVVGDRGLAWGRNRAMDVQNRPQGFAGNFWVQAAVLVIVVGVLIALAARYIW